MAIVFDTETTGLYDNLLLPLKQQPKIIEFSAVKLDDETLEVVDRIDTLLNPGSPLDPVITQITTITDEMLEGQPTWAAFQPRLTAFFLGQKRMVAHNCSFDRDVLSFELRRTDSLTKFPWPPEHVCTVEQTEHLKGYRLSLTDLYKELVNPEGFKEAHRAYADVNALVECYQALVRKGIIK